MLQRAGVQVMLNELSSTVVFERPLEEPFVRKWQLACQGDIAHVVVMPNITLDKLEAFVTDLIASRARHATATIQVCLLRIWCMAVLKGRGKLDIFSAVLNWRSFVSGRGGRSCESHVQACLAKSRLQSAAWC